MNMYERFQSEVGTERLERRAIEHVGETSETIKEQLAEELVARHNRKIFHGPDHTLPMEGDNLNSVVGGVRTLSHLLKESFKESLPTDGTVELVADGMEAGAVAHDVVIELKGVTEIPGTGLAGMIQRKRGWIEGGNEWESYRLFRRAYIAEYVGAEEQLSPEEEDMIHSILTDENAPEYDADYTRYMIAAERTVAGTDPDAMNFGASFDPKYVETFSEGVKRLVRGPAWTEENPTYAGFMIDSTKTAHSLEGLLASTADLGAVSDPERFIATGNAEFWELEYGIARDCTRFLEDENAIGSARLGDIARSMMAWRKTQVGVALGQKIRMEEKYTKENITDLFEVTFGNTPDEGEVEEFISGVKEAFKGADTSVEASAALYEEFGDRYGSLTSTLTGELTSEQRALFREAIGVMGGEVSILKNYVAHVDEELENLTLNQN